MLDERSKTQNDLMDYVRGILFGYSKGETLATYWKKHNTDYATVDFRFGVKAPCTAFSINTRFSLTGHRDACRASGNRTYKSNMDIENQ